MGPDFGKTAYISEVNGARKVSSDVQVVTNKNSDPVQIFFTYGWLGRTVPPTQFFYKLPELSETSGARKLISGLQVNSRRYDVTR